MCVQEDLVGKYADFQHAAVEAGLESNGKQHDRRGGAQAPDIGLRGEHWIGVLREPVIELDLQRAPCTGFAAARLDHERSSGIARIDVVLQIRAGREPAPRVAERVRSFVEREQAVDQVRPRLGEGVARRPHRFQAGHDSFLRGRRQQHLPLNAEAEGLQEGLLSDRARAVAKLGQIGGVDLCVAVRRSVAELRLARLLLEHEE